CAVLAFCFALVAVLLLTRRLAGALQHPLPPLLLVIAISTAAGVAFVIDRLAQKFGDGSSLQPALRWTATICLPLIALSVTIPRTSLPALIIVWLLVVAPEIAIWYPRSKPIAKTASRNADVVESQVKQQDSTTQIDHQSALSRSTEFESTQQLNYRIVDGHQIVDGWFQIALVANQRVATAHLAFCPAFDRSPQVDAECTSDTACTIQPALILPWGVRWEIKLDSPAAKNETLLIEFIARESPES
ncbi:MAG TPA: hypothetical protein VGI75_06675, partial [Pirellulales bacterium]